MIDVDYFALLLVKESKNKTLEIQIIVITETHDDFVMNQHILLILNRIKSSPFYSEIEIHKI